MFDQLDDDEEPLEIISDLTEASDSKFLPTFSDSIDNALGKKWFCTKSKKSPLSSWREQGGFVNKVKPLDLHFCMTFYGHAM